MITLDPDKIEHESNLDLILKPILEEYYDPKKLVLVEEPRPFGKAPNQVVTFAGFHGWFVQFLMKREEFNPGYKIGLYTVEAARKIIKLREARAAAKARARTAPPISFASLMGRFGIPLLMLSGGIVFLLLILITPGYAALVDLFLAR